MLSVPRVGEGMTPLTLLVGALAFFALNAFTQGLVSPTADLDQAQQLVLSQDLRWGYGTQPPLYTWIVYLIFRVTGPSLWVLSGIKVLLLGALIAGAIRVGMLLRLDHMRLALAVLGFALIPQIVWEAQRDLTHSVLATVFSMWTLWLVLAMREQADSGKFIALGILVGLGILSKYNFIFFLAALLLTGLSFAEYRRQLWTDKILISFTVAAALVAPHAYWLLMHVDTATASVGKLGINASLTPAAGLANLFEAAFQYSILLLAAWFLARRSGPVESLLRPFFARLLLILAVLLTLFVFVSGATQIKDRWMQPLLFFLPFVAISFSRLRPSVYASLSLVVMLVVALFLPGRTLLAESVGKPQRTNLPYHDLAAELRLRLGEPALIVSDKEFLAGNLRLAFPRSRIEVLASAAEIPGLAEKTGDKIRLFVTDDPRHGGGPSELARAVEAFVGHSLARVERPMLYMPSAAHSLYWVRL